MSTESQRCFLCGRWTRGVANRLCMVIKIDEQERRIKQGYQRRWKREMVGSILGERIHRICYRSIIKLEPLAVTRASSRPNKRKRMCKGEWASLPSSTNIIKNPGDHPNAPASGSSDDRGNLHVVDQENHRIQQFDLQSTCENDRPKKSPCEQLDPTKVDNRSPAVGNGLRR